MVWNDKVAGGHAADKKPSDFPQSLLQQGRTEEAEHSPNKHVQTEIAMDHLSKDKDYYKKLKIMEKTPLSKLQKLRKCMSLKAK